MAEIEIVDNEGLKMVKVTLNGDSIRSESGALHYMHGNIEMKTKAPSVGGFLKSMVSEKTSLGPYTREQGMFSLGLLPSENTKSLNWMAS